MRRAVRQRLGRPLALLLTSRPARRAWRGALLLVIVALVAGAVLASISNAAAIAGRVSNGRPAWLIVAAGLEVMSAIGFVVVFELVFGEWLPRRTTWSAGLAARAATIVIPAGGLLAIGAGARALRRRGMPSAKTGPRTIAFLLITNAPNLIVLGLLGVVLGSGLLKGPHGAALTTIPGAVALSVVVATALLPRVSHQRGKQRPLTFRHGAVSAVVRQLELGVIETRALLSGRSWKLLGAIALYAFDNAVLWATFKAFGHSHPPIATLVMAYLLGSTASALPIPGGIGAVEGGMVGLFVLYGAPAVCAGVAVLAYRAISNGLPLALGGAAFLALGRRASAGAPRARPSMGPC
jgi:uncharacterized membrane protein YbhN (UPF0104 family)